MAENDIEALAAKLEEQLAWATKHCPNAPYVPVRVGMIPTILTALRSTTAATDSAAKDAEIALAIISELRGTLSADYLDRIFGPDMKRRMDKALANRGEAGALAKERSE